MPFSFWGFFVPQADSTLQAAKDALDKNDTAYADHNLDACEKTLEQARKQTLEQIEKRNNGGYDPDEYCEGEDWGQQYKKGRNNGG